MNKTFNSYEEAQEYALTIPWKVTTCHVGESCWCRMIVPVEEIEYTHTYRDNTSEKDTIHIFVEGSINKTTAEYIVALHNQKVVNDRIYTALMEMVEDNINESNN
jgi:hypothetical protein